MKLLLLVLLLLLTTLPSMARSWEALERFSYK